MKAFTEPDEFRYLFSVGLGVDDPEAQTEEEISDMLLDGLDAGFGLSKFSAAASSSFS